MNHAHAAPFETGWVLPLVVTMALALPYVLSVLVHNRKKAQSRKKPNWSFWRSTSFVAGLIMLGLALAPDIVQFAHQDLRGHMLQHVLLGMLAPLGLVMAAPVTVILRALPAQAARYLTIFLHNRVVRFVSHPVTALVFNIGGMYLLYLTPLYALSLQSPPLHVFVHLHFVVAGCLFTWSIAGPDRGPRRPSWQFRLGVLFASIATHAFLAKTMYAYGWPRGTGHGLEDIQAAAKLMYYGGDLAELLLLTALLASVFGPLRQSRPVTA